MNTCGSGSQSKGCMQEAVAEAMKGEAMRVEEDVVIEVVEGLVALKRVVKAHPHPQTPSLLPPEMNNN